MNKKINDVSNAAVVDVEEVSKAVVDTVDEISKAVVDASEKAASKSVGAAKWVSHTAVDALDKVSSPSSRAGATAERVCKLVMGGLDKEVIALQLQKNSANEFTYTQQSVDVICNLYLDATTRVGITKKQTQALLDDKNDHSIK